MQRLAGGSRAPGAPSAYHVWANALRRPRTLQQHLQVLNCNQLLVGPLSCISHSACPLQVFVIQGGFSGWTSSKLQTRYTSSVSAAEVLAPLFGTRSTSSKVRPWGLAKSSL